jgi:hypothetical protein
VNHPPRKLGNKGQAGDAVGKTTSQQAYAGGEFGELVVNEPLNKSQARKRVKASDCRMQNAECKMQNAKCKTQDEETTLAPCPSPLAPRRSLLLGLLPTAYCLLLLIACGGCGNSSSPSGIDRIHSSASDPWQKERLDYAIDNLNRLEEFESGAMVRDILKQASSPNALTGTGAAAAGDLKNDALLATCPQPEMLRQVVDRLNQWIRSQPQPADWAVDPLVATLPQPLRELPVVKDLGKMEFSRYDGLALQEVVWLRDVSGWARGEELDELSRAKKLFDWMVRNIQLEPDAATNAQGHQAAIPQMPWEVLFLGRGTAIERAWLFVLLARQQGITATLLAVPETADAAMPEAADAAKEPLRPWAIGVLHEDDLYLFDPALGLPIPAPEGVQFDGARHLAIQPATLAQVVADEKLLRGLDLDASHPYPVKAADLAHVVALVEASPAYLSKRMRLIEPRLVAQQKMVLTTSASEQADRLKALPHLSDVRLWAHPYETFLRRSQLDHNEIRQRLTAYLPFYTATEGAEPFLYKGRLLYLKGKLIGEPSATQYFQMARTSNNRLENLANEYVAKSLPAVEKLPEEARKEALERIKAGAAQAANLETPLLLAAKVQASYWLGLVALQRGNYSSAIDYLARRTLDFVPDSYWAPGAIYNLARCLEAAGQTDKAASVYEQQSRIAGAHGNLLRARWLKTLAAAEEEK